MRSQVSLEQSVDTVVAWHSSSITSVMNSSMKHILSCMNDGDFLWYCFALWVSCWDGLRKKMVFMPTTHIAHTFGHVRMLSISFPGCHIFFFIDGYDCELGTRTWMPTGWNSIHWRTSVTDSFQKDLSPCHPWVLLVERRTHGPKAAEHISRNDAKVHNTSSRSYKGRAGQGDFWHSFCLWGNSCLDWLRQGVYIPLLILRPSPVAPGSKNHTNFPKLVEWPQHSMERIREEKH